FLGSIGLPVVMELIDRIRGRSARLSNHARTTIGFTAGLYVIFFLLFLMFEAIAAGSSAKWREIIASSSAQAINSRSAGFPFQFAYAFPRAMQWSLILAMLIGGG